jgi:hypothetical protein
MNTVQWIILGMTALSLLVTVIGWTVTYRKQVQLEHKQGDIQMTVQKQDTRLTYLHQRRGEVIAELYRLIVNIRVHLTASFRSLQEYEPTPEEQWNVAVDYFALLLDYYRNYQLFLNQSLCELIEKAIITLEQIAALKGIADRIQPTGLWPDLIIINQVKNFNDDAKKKVYEVLEPNLNLIEQEMREILDPHAAISKDK